MTSGHPSDCRDRRSKGVTKASDKKEAHTATSSPRTSSSEVDPFVRICVGCQEEKRCKPRQDDPSKPLARCSDCSKAYLVEWRKRNWQRAKARDTWKGMISRCHDPKHGAGSPPGVPRYAEYGAKGVKVAKRWRGPDGFKKFLADVGPPPEKDSTLDRINFKRNYTPSNCRWIDQKTQQQNKRRTRWVTALDPETEEELTLCVAEWGRRVGIYRSTLLRRLKRGWSPNDAVSIPVLAPGQRKPVFEDAPF